MTKTRKISVSLDAKLVDDLNFMSARMGVSRSAIISEIMADAIGEARRLFELIPPNPTPTDIVRMRGESEEVVRKRLASLQGIANDLFSK